MTTSKTAVAQTSNPAVSTRQIVVPVPVSDSLLSECPSEEHGQALSSCHTSHMRFLAKCSSYLLDKHHNHLHPAAKLPHLPQGYFILRVPRKHSNSADTYLFGHPSGRRFRSAIEFMPHLGFLASGQVSKCLCVLCQSDSTPASTTNGRRVSAKPKLQRKPLVGSTVTRKMNTHANRQQTKPPDQTDLQDQTDACMEEDLESDLSSVDSSDLTSSDVECAHDIAETPALNERNLIPLRPAQLPCKDEAKEKLPSVNRSVLLPRLCSLRTSVNVSAQSRGDSQSLKNVSRFSSIQIVLDSNSRDTLASSGKMNYLGDVNGAIPDADGPQDVRTPTSPCDSSNLQIPSVASKIDSYNAKLHDVIDEYLQDSGQAQDLVRVDELLRVQLLKNDAQAPIDQASNHHHELGRLRLNASPADLFASNPISASFNFAASKKYSAENRTIIQTYGDMARNEHQIITDTEVGVAQKELAGTSEPAPEKDQGDVDDALPNDTSSQEEQMDDMHNDSDADDLQNEHTLVDENMRQLLDDSDLQDCLRKNGETMQSSAQPLSVARHPSVNGRSHHKPNGVSQGAISDRNTLQSDATDETQGPINCTTRPKYANRRPGKRLTRLASCFLQQLLRKPERIEIPYKTKGLRKKANWEKAPK
ncbi:hypothetical protein BJ741DRAFT_606558 [Chytriomyces cf. hyalinus JEL632]|nr:hypothetical protein BJ741DRAFT_606558 [Chytriomyces cf. hyalinus JEL632]